ncbi:MAG: hypothetical protein Q7J85_06915 [Bacillota bacterium]|nr:hypothetical protein [Bacillota bacterium]
MYRKNIAEERQKHEKKIYIGFNFDNRAGTAYLLTRHFLPELFPLFVVSMISLAGMAIITEASLSFLGLGDPTSRSWGLIINHAVNFRGIYFTPFWKWWLLYPWLFLTLLVTSLSLLGRDMERMADPRMKKAKLLIMGTPKNSVLWYNLKLTSFKKKLVKKTFRCYT